MSDMWWSRGVGCGLVVVLAVGLVACRGGEEPTPAPSGSGASPTVEASPSLDATVDEQELIDEAIAALTEYLALANEVENAGGEGWEEKLKPWWGSQEMIDAGTLQFTTMLDNGWHHEGASVATNLVGHAVSLPDQTIKISYCLDARGVRAVDSEGSEVAHGVDHPFPGEAELRHAEERWLVMSVQVDRSAEC